MSDDVNAYIAKQRALARERQQRSRDRRRNGHVTSHMLDDNGKVNSSVQRVASGIMQGLSKHQALLQAGCSPSADRLITKAKQGLAEALREQGLTISKVVDSTLQSIDAESPMLTADGSIDRPDWSARSAGRRDAIALLDRAGELPQASQPNGNGNVTLVLQSLNVTLDVVDHKDDNDAITSDGCKVVNP
jgi:hypothetical protein